ncbi:MXAN_6640 family putative metalloprotease [Candidatus Latescibacterota bacterium]
MIDQAEGSGALSPQTALLYRVYDLLDRDLLPEPFHAEPRVLFCGTPVLVAANANLHPAAKAGLGSVLQRPALDLHRQTPGGHFRVHFTIDGDDAVSATDLDANGTPDYIDSVAAVLDRAWELEVEELGYPPPPTDGGAGGGDEYDVYVLDLGQWGSAKYGLTFPESEAAVTSSFMEVDNDYTNPAYGRAGDCEGHPGSRGLDALRVTVAHEFFHAIQFGYYQGWDGSWWQEASSTWMEEIAYPDIDDYLQYVCAFLGWPQRSLDSGRPLIESHPYGACIFPHFLDQRYGRELIRSIWEELGRRLNADLTHFDRAIRQVDEGGLDSAIGQFAVWNYFTGSHHRDGFYLEGHAYPELPLRPTPLLAGESVSDHGQVDHLASAYFSLQPQLRRGGLSIDTDHSRGSWRRQLVLVSPDSVEVRRPGPVGAITLPDWDAYDEVVLVLTCTEEEGGGYRYRVTLDFDLDLVDVERPVALRLGDPYPNPLRLPEHARAIFPYALNRTSAVTRLSVFSATGELIRQLDLGARAAHEHHVEWDGRNARGGAVASGIYNVLLESDGRSRMKTLAVVRE